MKDDLFINDPLLLSITLQPTNENYEFHIFGISDSHSITSQNLNIVRQGRAEVSFFYSFGNSSLKRFSSGKDNIY